MVELNLQKTPSLLKSEVLLRAHASQNPKVKEAYSKLAEHLFVDADLLTWQQFQQKYSVSENCIGFREAAAILWQQLPPSYYVEDYWGSPAGSITPFDRWRLNELPVLVEQWNYPMLEWGMNVPLSWSCVDRYYENANFDDLDVNQQLKNVWQEFESACLQLDEPMPRESLEFIKQAIFLLIKDEDSATGLDPYDVRDALSYFSQNLSRFSENLNDPKYQDLVAAHLGSEQSEFYQLVTQKLEPLTTTEEFQDLPERDGTYLLLLTMTTNLFLWGQGLSSVALETTHD